MVEIISDDPAGRAAMLRSDWTSFLISVDNTRSSAIEGGGVMPRCRLFTLLPF